MQKFLSIYFSLCLIISIIFTACSSSIIEEVPSNEEEQTAIGFAAMVENSRAIAELEDVQNNGFSVWGGFGNTNVFDATKVTYTDADGWGYGETRYWTYNTYNFYAVYPDQDRAAYASVTGDNTTKQLEIKEFDASKEYDLMHAEFIGADGSERPLIGLKFKHLLTNISVKLQKSYANSSDNVIVTGVYIFGVKNKGDYTLVDNKESWSNQSDQSYVGLDLTSSGITLDAKEAGENGKDHYKECASGLLVIPQDITEQIMLFVRYTYASNGGATMQKTLTSSLPDSPAWEIGTKINYTGTIFVDDKIEFSIPTVETWGAEQTGGTIIIQ